LYFGSGRLRQAFGEKDDKRREQNACQAEFEDIRQFLGNFLEDLFRRRKA